MKTVIKIIASGVFLEALAASPSVISSLSVHNLVDFRDLTVHKHKSSVRIDAGFIFPGPTTTPADTAKEIRET